MSSEGEARTAVSLDAEANRQTWKQIHFLLPADEAAELMEFAKSVDRSVSSVIRRALRPVVSRSSRRR